MTQDQLDALRAELIRAQDAALAANAVADRAWAAYYTAKLYNHNEAAEAAQVKS